MKVEVGRKHEIGCDEKVFKEEEEGLMDIDQGSMNGDMNENKNGVGMVVG